LVLCVAVRVSKGRADDLSPIEPIWIEAGCLLADWFIQERLRIEAGWKGMDSGKPTLVDKVYKALREAGAAGLTKSELWGKVGKATPKGALDDALKSLGESGLAEQVFCPTGSNKPTELWRAKGV